MSTRMVCARVSGAQTAAVMRTSSASKARALSANCSPEGIWFLQTRVFIGNSPCDSIQTYGSAEATLGVNCWCTPDAKGGASTLHCLLLQTIVDCPGSAPKSVSVWLREFGARVREIIGGIYVCVGGRLRRPRSTP